MKGHLHNLLPEVPHLLPPMLKEECQKLLGTTIPKQKVQLANQVQYAEVISSRYSMCYGLCVQMVPPPKGKRVKL